MAKLTEQTILDYISELDIDNQITILETIRLTVVTNVTNHKADLDKQSKDYSDTLSKINGNA